MRPSIGTPARTDRSRMDYGHELEFGVFHHADQSATGAARSGSPQLAEAGGFDLATFQDHPYQPSVPRHVDAHELDRGIAPRASASPPRCSTCRLRQPAVVARSAASLDLLSGGRVELGLGSGGFWDAMKRRWAASGSRPGQGVLAPGEAIDDHPRECGTRASASGVRARRRAPPGERARSEGPAPDASDPRSTSAQGSRACCASPAGSATAGGPRSATCSPATSAAGNQTIDEAARASRPRPARDPPPPQHRRQRSPRAVHRQATGGTARHSGWRSYNRPRAQRGRRHLHPRRRRPRP